MGAPGDPDKGGTTIWCAARAYDVSAYPLYSAIPLPVTSAFRPFLML